MTRLFVHNLAWHATSDSLMEYLRQQNFAVETVEVITNRATGRSKGFAFVEFTNPIAASAALDAFRSGKLHLDGRKLGANEAHPKREQPETFRSSPAPTPPAFAAAWKDESKPAHRKPEGGNRRGKQHRHGHAGRGFQDHD
jgi:cold-inducible RNA-binding protein